MTPRHALWALIALSMALRLTWAASLGPGNDEAYHYLFAVHPDWSYFDHPPMLAVVERVGLMLNSIIGGQADSVLGLRLGFILLFAGSTWLMARLGTRIYSEWAGFFAAFLLNVSAYHTAAAGAFALPDGPLLFFWLLTLDRLVAALESPERTRVWVEVGLAWGAALLSKYHAVFLPAGMVLYLLLEPEKRRLILRPGPYLAVLVGGLCFAPVVVWNASHNWASFAFQSGRAIGGGGFRPESLLAAIFLPGLYLLPWIWVGLLWVLLRKARRFRSPDTRPEERFLLCEVVVPLGLFLAVACTRPVLPHWTLVGFLPLFPILGDAFATAYDANRPRWFKRAAILAGLPVIVASFMVIETRTGILQKGRPGGLGLVQANRDPTSDLIGWETVAGELKRRGLLDKPDTFLFTSTWYHSGQLDFSTRESSTPVLCYHPWDARSFAFWSKPSEWVGRDGILVSVNNRPGEPECFRKWFKRIEPIATFEIDRHGAPIRKVRLYQCLSQIKPFPFDDLGATLAPKRHEVRPRESKLARDQDSSSDRDGRRR